MSTIRPVPSSHLAQHTICNASYPRPPKSSALGSATYFPPSDTRQAFRLPSLSLIPRTLPTCPRSEHDSRTLHCCRSQVPRQIQLALGKRTCAYSQTPRPRQSARQPTSEFRSIAPLLSTTGTMRQIRLVSCNPYLLFFTVATAFGKCFCLSSSSISANTSRSNHSVDVSMIDAIERQPQWHASRSCE